VVNEEEPACQTQPGLPGRCLDDRRASENAVDGLRDQLAVANRRVDEERQRVEEERTPVADAQAAERIARDEAAGLRTRLDKVMARGLWAQLGNKR
jgi:hypothetical protein